MAHGPEFDAIESKNQAVLAHILELEKEQQRVRESIARWEAAIRAERSNPSGVVSLRDLHDYGEYILENRNELAHLVALEQVDLKESRRLTAEEMALLKSCPKVRK